MVWVCFIYLKISRRLLVEGRGGYGFNQLSLRLFVFKADETHPYGLPQLYRYVI